MEMAVLSRQTQSEMLLPKTAIWILTQIGQIRATAREGGTSNKKASPASSTTVATAVSIPQLLLCLDFIPSNATLPVTI